MQKTYFILKIAGIFFILLAFRPANDLQSKEKIKGLSSYSDEEKTSTLNDQNTYQDIDKNASSDDLENEKLVIIVDEKDLEKLLSDNSIILNDENNTGENLGFLLSNITNESYLPENIKGFYSGETLILPIDISQLQMTTDNLNLVGGRSHIFTRNPKDKPLTRLFSWNGKQKALEKQSPKTQSAPNLHTKSDSSMQTPMLPKLSFNPQAGKLATSAGEIDVLLAPRAQAIFFSEEAVRIGRFDLVEPSHIPEMSGKMPNVLEESPIVIKEKEKLREAERVQSDFSEEDLAIAAKQQRLATSAREEFLDTSAAFIANFQRMSLAMKEMQERFGKDRSTKQFFQLYSALEQDYKTIMRLDFEFAYHTRKGVFPEKFLDRLQQELTKIDLVKNISALQAMLTPEFKNGLFFKEMDAYFTKNYSGLHPDDFFIKHFQRLGKFELLIREWMKSTPNSSAFYKHLNDTYNGIKSAMVSMNLRQRITEAQEYLNKSIDNYKKPQSDEFQSVLDKYRAGELTNMSKDFHTQFSSALTLEFDAILKNSKTRLDESVKNDLKNSLGTENFTEHLAALNPPIPKRITQQLLGLHDIFSPIKVLSPH